MRMRCLREWRRETIAARVVSTRRPQNESWRVVRLGVIYAICSILSELRREQS